MRNKYIKIGILLFSSVSAMFSFWAWQIVKTPNFKVEEDKNYELLISSDDTFESVYSKLAMDSVVIDELSFKFLAKLLNYTDHVKRGRYLINNKQGNLELINKLRRGIQDPFKLTINSWRTKEDLAGRISKQMPIDSVSIINKLNSKEYCEGLGFNQESILSMFIPNTYFLYYTRDFDEISGRMKKEYSKFWNEERMRKSKKLGFNPVEVSILASIVEGESKISGEQARIAGVYFNRLKINIPLQADPTVVFALKDFSIKRVTKKHIIYDSPYNTYRHTGLPPGPISIPNIQVIDHVLNLEKNDYLYFCANPDFSGTHLFASNYQEHLRNANLYQKALNQHNIR